MNSKGQDLTRQNNLGRLDQGCFISKQDWDLLRQRGELEREKGCRNLCLGVATSGFLGTLSTIVANFGQLSARTMGPVESALLVLVASATFSASALAVFFHHRVKVNGSDRALEILSESIQIQLEEPQAADDPRQWP